MDDVLKIATPVRRCPKCREPIGDWAVYAYACMPPIYQYPCGCKVQYVESRQDGDSGVDAWLT